MATEAYAGPIDYLVFTFPLGADVAPGLRKVLDRVDEGVIELLDLEVMGRDDDAQPVSIPLADIRLSATPRIECAEFDGVHSGILDAQDRVAIAESLERGHLAIAIVYEDRSLATAAQAWTLAGGAELFSGGVDIRELESQLEGGTER